MTYLLAFPVALLSSLLLTPLLRTLAVKRSLFDVPDGKRFHSSPVPLLGGVSVLSAVLVGSAVTCVVLHSELKIAHLLLGSGLILSFVLGMHDDRMGMAARWKICGQAVCAVFLVVGCYIGGWIEGTYLFQKILHSRNK